MQSKLLKNQKLLTLVQHLSGLVERERAEPELLKQGAALLATLVAQDDWLPEQFTVPHPEFYRQYLLYADPLERFSVVSFVWGAGQKTPVHDHMTWGLIGMLRGQEIDTHYFKQADGSYVRGESHVLTPGNVCSVSPMMCMRLQIFMRTRPQSASTCMAAILVVLVGMCLTPRRVQPKPLSLGTTVTLSQISGIDHRV